MCVCVACGHVQGFCPAALSVVTLIAGLLSCMVLAASNPPRTWGLSSSASAQEGCLVGCHSVARGWLSLPSAVNQPCCWRRHPVCETWSSGRLSTAWWAVSDAPRCLQTCGIAPLSCANSKPTLVCMLLCKGLGGYWSCYICWGWSTCELGALARPTGRYIGGVTSMRAGVLTCTLAPRARQLVCQHCPGAWDHVHAASMSHT